MGSHTLTATEVRSWMNSERRGYSAAAKHFGIDESELRELCSMKEKPSSRARPRARTKREVAQVEQTVEVPDVEDEDPVAALLRWHEQELAAIEAARLRCPPAAVSTLFRQARLCRLEIEKLRGELRAKDASKLTEKDVMERAADHAKRMSDRVLEVFVAEYLRRTRTMLTSS